MTADTTGTDMVKNALNTATNFEGSAEEAQVAIFLGHIGIKYSKITKEELAVLLRVLRK